jgi:hypothetical protein
MDLEFAVSDIHSELNTPSALSKNSEENSEIGSIGQRSSKTSHATSKNSEIGSSGKLAEGKLTKLAVSSYENSSRNTNSDTSFLKT